MRIFITGATGLIGRRLTAALHKRGDHVVALSRSAIMARAKLGSDVEIVEGDIKHYGPWARALDGVDAAVNFVGEPIFAKRWTDEQREMLRGSRIGATQNLVQAITHSAKRPRVLISGSAIGYYGYHEDEDLTEQSSPGEDFLARLAVEWEQAARAAEQNGLRVVIIRTGVVLDREGGALAQMLPPFRAFVGGPVGSGRQWLSWIHHDDIVGIVLFALDHEEVAGVINGTAPEPATNREFSKTLASVLRRPCIFRVPAFMLRLRFGEAADLVIKGQRVLPARTQALGYQYRFPSLHPALKDLLRGD